MYHDMELQSIQCKHNKLRLYCLRLELPANFLCFHYLLGVSMKDLPCPCDGRTDIRCDDTHCDIAGPVGEGICRVCWNRLGHNPAVPANAYADLGNKRQASPGKYAMSFRRANPCHHLGEPTGETRDCSFCGGAKNISLLSCAIHGRCTTERHLAYREKDGGWVQVAFCLSCTEYQPEEKAR